MFSGLFFIGCGDDDSDPSSGTGVAGEEAAYGDAQLCRQS